MAKINKKDFIKDMLAEIEQQLSFLEELENHPLERLEVKANAKAWNALECVGHMNKAMSLYTDQMKSISLPEGKEIYVSIGMKGRWFAEGMRPKGEKISYKMPTTGIFKPSVQSTETINELKETLNWAKSFLIENKDRLWRRAKVTSALGPLVKFNLAEAFNFLLAHNQRHILQAKKAIQA